jgi:RNA-directed DNA polymerase
LSNTILGVGKAWKQEVLIEKLNIQIREWTNYHQSVVSNDFFSHIDYVLFNLLYRWAKRRHPKKAHKWIIQKYWRTVGTSNWVFATEKTALLRVDYIAIVRHKKVRMNANPYFDVEYFKNRNIL